MLPDNRCGFLPVALRMRQKPVIRGAVSKQPAARKAIDWSVFYRGAIVLVVLVLVAGAGYAIEALISMPVSRVMVNGEFRQIDRQVIVKEVKPFLSTGFINLDLDGIRHKLQSHPWIFRVEVVRQWPNEISIFVEEQTVIARWGNKGFLNKRGELFVPKKTNMKWIDVEHLPFLDGPEGSFDAVMSHFRELSDALLPHNLALNELVLNQRGSWVAQLQNGTRILFGTGDVMVKTQRFLRAYQQILAKDFEQVEAIDMRYSLGFAVSWRQGRSPASVASVR